MTRHLRSYRSAIVIVLNRVSNFCFWVRRDAAFIVLSAALLAVGLAFPVANAQTHEWEWVGGSSTRGEVSVYGTLGVAANTNMPGGRQAMVGWTDKSGKLWLFGGYGEVNSGENPLGPYTLNDLWEFDPSTEEWTWMGGSQGAVPNGVSGVYGTLGVPAPGNIPSTRSNASVTTDTNGNAWIFGGTGDGQGGSLINDLWEFNPTTNEWAWISGSSTAEWYSGQYGVYGTLGVPSAGNVPGSRESGALWADSNGNLWLFGGIGLASSGKGGLLNDLWEFDPSTQEWAWMGGSSTAGWPAAVGSYGTLGMSSATNVPGGRSGAATWIDSNGNFWLFGGVGYDAAGYEGSLNDLWELSPSTNEWAWMGGNSTLTCITTKTVGTPCFSLGVYGTMGTPAAGNIPGGRQYSVNWIDASGNFWLFGGNGYDANVNAPGLNDLWEFSPSTLEWTWTGGPSTENCILWDTGYCINWTEPAYEYPPMETLGSTYIPPERYSAVGWTDKNNNQWLFGGVSVFDDLWEYQALSPAATPTFSVAPGTYASAQTVIISDATHGASIYYTTDGTTPTANSTSYTGSITVSTSETIQAMATATGYLQSALATATYSINLPPSFTVSGTAVTVTPGATTGNTSTITLTPSGGFTGAVSLSCTITPIAASDPATCSIPASVTISGATAQTTILTVNSTAATTSLNRIRKLIWPLVGGWTFAIVLLFGIPARRRRWQTMLGMLVLLASFTSGAFACGGGGGNGGGGGGGGGNTGTTPGTYTVTVTGTSGTINATGKVTLTVQ